MRKTIFLAMLFFFMLLGPRVARADDAAIAEAKARFQEGVQLADQGKHDEARLKFQQAAAVLKAAAVLYNLARAEQLSGHDFEAIDHYRQFLRLAEHDGTIKDAQRADAKKYIADLTPKVGQVDVEAPPAARVSIDGKALEESPPKEPVAVPPGRHTVEAAFEGKLKSITVECEAGKVTKAKIEFETGGTTEPPPAGGSGPGWSTGRILTVAGLGVGAAVGITLGVVFASGSQSAKTDSENLRSGHPGLCAFDTDPNCQAYDSKRSTAKTDAAIAYVGYVAGGLFAAGAIAAALVWPKDSEHAQTQPRVTPLISPTACGASFAAAF